MEPASQGTSANRWEGPAATRYDRLASNYLAFVQPASIRLWLRVSGSGPLVKRIALPPLGTPSFEVKSFISSFSITPVYAAVTRAPIETALTSL